MNANSCENTEGVLKKIIHLRGTESLADGKMLVSMYRDLSDQKMEQRMIQYFVETGGHTALLEAKHLSPAMQKARFDQTVSKMCVETLVSEEVARQVCDSFWSAVYGSPLENPSVQQPQDEQKQQIGQKPHEEQKIAEKPMVLEVKYETPQPPKKHHLLTCLAGCAVCAILLFLGYIGISAETALPEQRINPEYTALFREYGFEDHTIDFEGKETLASARFYKGGEIAGVTATSQELGITVTEYILEDGILVETVRYNYKPFNVFELKKTAQEREELVATQARIAKDESTTTEYAVCDDYYVLIYRYHDVMPYDREQVKAIIATDVVYGSSIAREND